MNYNLTFEPYLLWDERGDYPGVQVERWRCVVAVGSGLAAREPGLNAGQSGLGRQIPKLVIRLAHGGRKNAEFSK